MALKDQSELQETELGQLTATAADSLEKHAKTIVIAFVVVIVVLIVAVVVTNSNQNERSRAWDAFAAAAANQSAEDFANVASDFPGTDVALWARLNEAEVLFREGVRLQFTDRAAANSQLNKSLEAFESVLGNSDAPVEARERALLGHAQLLESKAGSAEDVQAAIAAYEKFQREFPESPVYGSTVEARIEALKADASVEFYKWFAAQNPKPEDREQPRDGMPPGHPDLPVTLPDIPEELYPSDWKPEFEETDGDTPAAPELILPELPAPAEGDSSDSEAGDAPTPNE